MKIFISWSGDLSKQVAKLLRDWLPNVIQSVEPWMSETDILVGQRWSTELAVQLEEASCALVCITSDNKNKPWLQFEAGSLARSLTGKVIPVLFDISATDLDGPLAQFQAATMDENGMRSVVTSIHRSFDSKLTSERLIKSFEKFWPDLAQGLENLRGEEVVGRIIDKKVPHNMEFEDHHDAPTWRSTAPTIVPAKLLIQFSSLSVADCESLKLKQDSIKSFVMDEAERHPILFSNPFSSIPLPFQDCVMLISWDGGTVKIERLLPRENAYSAHAAWSDCLATYRQATMLPYRQRDPSILIHNAEARRSVNTYKRLLTRLDHFASNSPDAKIISSHLKDLRLLFEEARMSLDSGDIGTSTSRLEAILSIVHKLILRYVPHGIGEYVIAVNSIDANKATSLKPTSQHDNSPSILIVDDDLSMLRSLMRALEDLKIYAYGTSSSVEAFRLMVDGQFDIVITDLRMPAADGLEIIRAAKRHNADCQCIVLTGYANVPSAKHAMKLGAFDFLSKPISIEELAHIIRMASAPAPDSEGEKITSSKEQVRQSLHKRESAEPSSSAAENKRKPRRPSTG